jgi:hypothetical protein
MSRKQAEDLHQKVLKAVQDALGEEYQVTFPSYRFGSDMVEGKITIAKKSDDGVPANFTMYASRFGMRDSDYRRMFQVGSNYYRVVDIRPSARKYPIIATRHDGKKFKFAAQTVLNNWK